MALTSEIRRVCAEVKGSSPLIYLGTPRNGRFFRPISAGAIGQEACYIFGNRVNGWKLDEVERTLRNVSRINEVTRPLSEIVREIDVKVKELC